MTQAPLSHPDQRLAVVAELGLLDSHTLPALGAIARLVQRQTGWSIGAISLVGKSGQRLIASAGFDDLPRDERYAFCERAVTEGGFFEVFDAHQDARFAHSTAVLCAYAGLPLHVDGCAVGMLFASRTEPARLEPSQLPALQDLATAAAALLQAHLHERRSNRQTDRVRGASRTASDWLWETDAQGVVTWVSSTVEAHTGEPPEATIGRKAQAYNRPREDEHRASYDAYVAAREQRKPFRDAVAERNTARGRLTISISGDPVFASDGCFMGYRGAARNVTEMIALRQRAARAELLLRGSIEHSHAAMMIADPSGEIIVSNAAWRSGISQYLPVSTPPISSLQAQTAALVAAGAFPQARGREQAFIAGRLAQATEGHGIHELQFGDTHQLVSDQRLSDGCTVHMAIDITEHKKAQSALLEQQLRLTAVLRAIPDLWFVIDREGRHLECSDDSHPRLHAPFDSFLGQRLDEVLPAEVAGPAHDALTAALNTHEVQRFEYELPHGDGLRQFEGRMAPMGSDRVLFLVRDLSGLRALERNVHLMQRAFEAPGAVPMVMADATQPDMPLVYVNEAFEKLSGRARAEVLGRNCSLLQGNDRDQPGLAVLREALSSERACVVELRNYRADGSPFINELHVAPIRDRAGRLTHYIGVQHDVTERRQAERLLQLSEVLYRSVTTTISDGLLVVDAQGATTTINPAACRMLGMPLEALAGGSLREIGFQLMHEDGTPLPKGRDPVTEVLRGGVNVVGRVLCVRRPDGAERIFSINAHRLQAETGVAEIACVLTFRDITEQRANERGMAQAEARWRFALEEAGDGLLDHDEDTQRTFFSPRWKAMLGYTHHEIGQAPQEWSHRIHPDDYPRVMQAVRRYRAGALPEYRSEHRLRHKNGHWLWVLDRAKIIERRPDGSPRRLISVHTDITRLKAAEHALRDKRAAEMASAAKSEFLSRMSHEMRTPLNAVIGFAQLLQMRGEAGRPIPVAQYSEHILHSGRHLLSLVNDVLDLQQVEAGRMALAAEPVLLRRALESACLLVEAASKARQIIMAIDVDPNLRVLADPRRLQQVLLNLLSNGVKYNRIGGTLRCELESIEVPSAGASMAALIIEDSGEGLTPEQMSNLFQPFERLGRETSTVEGSGLGLVISRALVREMNGSLTMSSQVGVGSRVRVELPLARLAADGSQAVPSALSGTAQPALLRMLYVEDNRLNALLFEEAIKMRGGVELRVVEDGPDALELLRAWYPDVLVLDAHLPSMSGYEVLARLRQQPRFAQTPAFMCSADAQPDELQRARNAGFAGYWSKPIDIAQVMRELDALPPVSALSRQ